MQSMRINKRDIKAHTTIVYTADRTKTIPTRRRDDMVSTKTAERRLRLRSSYVILADEQ